VPDIYDSAKYDALHNAHLALVPTLTQLYKEAKVLADAVIPNECVGECLVLLDVWGVRWWARAVDSTAPHDTPPPAQPALPLMKPSTFQPSTLT
jgi:hypothetical protein